MMFLLAILMIGAAFYLGNKGKTTVALILGAAGVLFFFMFLANPSNSILQAIGLGTDPVVEVTGGAPPPDPAVVIPPPSPILPPQIQNIWNDVFNQTIFTQV